MRNVVYLLVALQCAGMSHLLAQGSACPPLPDDRSWHTPEDFLSGRDSVKKVLDWLCRTPLSIRVGERSEANAVVLIWIAGTPEPVVRVETSTMPFLVENEELLYPVIHGMARYQMAHPRETDKVKIHAAGLEVLAELAEQSESLRGVDSLKPLRRAWRRGRLTDYVQEHLKE